MSIKNLTTGSEPSVFTMAKFYNLVCMSFNNMLKNSKYRFSATVANNNILVTSTSVHAEIEDFAIPIDLIGDTSEALGNGTFSAHHVGRCAELVIGKFFDKIAELDNLSKTADLKNTDLKDAKYYEFHIDLETGDFNKVNPNGHGARDAMIYEVGVALVDSNHNVVFKDQLFIDTYKCDKVATYTNAMFHVRNGYDMILCGHDGSTEPRKTVSIKEAETIIVELLRDTIPEIKKFEFGNKHIVRLSGKSSFFDMDFIQQQMPTLSQYLSYEILDLSAFKNLARRSNPKFVTSDAKVSHVALEDALQTVAQSALIKEFWDIMFHNFNGNTLQEMINNMKVRGLSAPGDHTHKIVPKTGSGYRDHLLSTVAQANEKSPLEIGTEREYLPERYKALTTGELANQSHGTLIVHRGTTTSVEDVDKVCGEFATAPKATETGFKD